MKTVNHQFLNQPWFLPNWECKTLIIGSFNPECGEQIDYFYGRSRANRFWRAVADMQGLDWMYYYHNEDGFERKMDKLKSCKVGCADLIRTLEVQDEFIDNICGNGYSDSHLFNLGRVRLHYNTHHIIDRLGQGDISQVIFCLGVRNHPNEFVAEKIKLRSFCQQISISFIDDEMNFSGRGGRPVAEIASYLSKFFEC